jgi:hypothetical protein
MSSLFFHHEPRMCVKGCVGLRQVLAIVPFLEGRNELGRLGIERGTNTGRRDCRIELIGI